jgi:hypothetical protein
MATEQCFGILIQISMELYFVLGFQNTYGCDDAPRIKEDIFQGC